MNNYLWLLLIPYCAVAFAIHGGQIITGINRPVRNLICAIPFYFCFQQYSLAISLPIFLFAFVGVNIGHENFWLMQTGKSIYRPTWLSLLVEWLGFKPDTLAYDIAGMAVKGTITFPFGGGLVLPLAYYIGDRIRFNTSMSEWLSGIFYGVLLSFIGFYS